MRKLTPLWPDRLKWGKFVQRYIYLTTSAVLGWGPTETSIETYNVVSYLGFGVDNKG